MSSATVIHPGFYSSIQDFGRKTYRDLGVPHGGAMDQEAMRLANEALENTPDAAVIEMIMQGVTLHFSDPTTVMVLGNVDKVALNTEPIDFTKPIDIEAGDQLKIGRVIKGHFAYLAILGGWQTEVVLGSRSMFKGITSSARLNKGEVLEYRKEDSKIHDCPSVFIDISRTLNVFRGPEFNALSEAFKALLFHTEFKLSSSWNRMAYVLKTDQPVAIQQISTSPVLPGTVQLTPVGDLIVLMRDAQTTGGYPRILQLSEEAVNQLTRKQVGERIQFKLLEF